MLASESVFGNRWNGNIVKTAKGCENLREEDEWEGEEKKKESNDGKSDPPGSHPARVFLVEVDLGKSSETLLLLATDLHPRVDIGAQTSTS